MTGTFLGGDWQEGGGDIISQGVPIHGTTGERLGEGGPEILLESALLHTSCHIISITYVAVKYMHCTCVSLPASYRPGDRMRKHSKEEQKEL